MSVPDGVEAVSFAPRRWGSPSKRGDCFPVAFGFEMMRFRTAAGNLIGGLSSFANGRFVPRSEVIGPAMWATGEVGLQLAVPGAQAAGDLCGGMFPMIQPPIAKAPS